MVDNTSIRFEVLFLLSFIELLNFFDEYNEVSLYSVLAEVYSLHIMCINIL